MKKFTLIWFGQLVSLVGSGLTGFALGVWVYSNTGLVTKFALISLVTSLPGLLFSPFAGVYVDRWDKRKLMILSDSGAGLCTLILAILLWLNKLDIWHIYILMGISSTFGAFQWPAFISLSTKIVDKNNLGRVSGMMQTAQAVAYVLAPVIGGLLFVAIGVKGVIAIDFATFLFAMVILLVVKVSITSDTKDGKKEKNMIKEVVYGFKYIVSRNGLFALLIFFAVNNFIIGSINVLATPLILSLVSPSRLGIVLSIAGSGMLIGGILMSIWKGPKNRMSYIYIFSLLGGLCIAIAGLWLQIWVFTIAAFIIFLTVPVINASSQYIWQTKIDPDVQGRVFALRRMTALSTMPLAYAISGPLADNIFEPVLAVNGTLADSIIGRVIGVGSGRGIAFMFVMMGLIFMGITFIGYLYKPLRNLEDNIPDVI